MKPEYLHLFEMSLHEKLKEKINARIYCAIKFNDELIIEIKKDNIVFNYVAGSDMSLKILKGLSSDEIVDEVVSAYKRFILGKYFYM